MTWELFITLFQTTLGPIILFGSLVLGFYRRISPLLTLAGVLLGTAPILSGFSDLHVIPEIPSIVTTLLSVVGFGLILLSVHRERHQHHV